MEIAAIAGTALLGYAIGQKKKAQTFATNATIPLESHAKNYQAFINPQFENEVGCAQAYPFNSGLTPKNYIPQMEQRYQKWREGQHNMYYPAVKDFKKEAQQEPEGKEAFGNVDFDFNPNTNSIGMGNANSEQSQDYVLDMNSRPVTDFTHNNMVPFYGAHVTQNMQGTGVPTGNYIDGETINSGFDNTTPWHNKLANFTGQDDTYLHKREVGPQFSPAEQQTGWVYGSPLFRPDLSRYTNSLHIRNDLSPVEAQQVGPGLALDPSVPAQGGFQQFTRVMPNNVSDYKANQLEGRVIAQKWQLGGNKPTSLPGVGLPGENNGQGQYGGPGVAKHRPNAFWSQERRPTMTTKAGFVDNYNFIRPDYTTSFKPNNASRDQTSYGYGSLVNPDTLPPNVEQINNQSPNNQVLSYGANPNDMVKIEEFGNVASEATEMCVSVQPAQIGSGIVGGNGGIPLTTARSPTWMSQDNNIRSKTDCNSIPIGNPGNPGQAMGNISTNYYVNQTDRGQVNPQNVSQLNLGAQIQRFNNLSYTDQQKTTTKETTEYAYAGNAQNENQGNKFWSYGDAPKTTNKETTQFAYAGNVARKDATTVNWMYGDKPKTTDRETTEYSYSGNPGRPGEMMTSYNQFTGFPTTPIKEEPNNNKKIESFSNIDNPYTNNKPQVKNGGADTFSLRATTLVENWTPIAGRQNILADAQNRMGKIDFGTFGCDQNSNGPGTINQALPNAAKYQYKQYMAEPHAAPNKLIGLDERQTAPYLVSALKENPLSIYTTEPKNKIPALFCDIEPDNFSTVLNKKLTSEDQPSAEESLLEKTNNVAVQVYPSDEKAPRYNPNSQMVFSLSKNSKETVNDLLIQNISQPNEEPLFTGKCYSGNPNLNENAIMGGENPPNVYGPIPSNKALNFAGGNTLVLPSLKSS